MKLKTTEKHVLCTAMHTLLSVHSFILPLVLLRSVTLCYPSCIKSDKATINIERAELDADYVNLHASTPKSAVDCLGVCVYFLAQMVEVNELFQGTDPPYAVRTAVCIPWTAAWLMRSIYEECTKYVGLTFTKTVLNLLNWPHVFCLWLQTHDVVSGIYY